MATFWFIPLIPNIASKFARTSMKSSWIWSALESTFVLTSELKLFLYHYFLPFSVPIILVGNKTDLHVDRRVTQEQGKNLAAEMKAAFLETSAKENQNVEDIFRRVIAQMENIEGGGGGGEEKKCIVM